MEGVAAPAHEFREGAIVRLALHNFMTYTDVEVKPGPRLNIVLGPNGTGKSSLVCGIGLALAGKPKILGRAKELGSFVRHGADTGWTEVELHRKNARNVVVRRELQRGSKTSKWYLDGRPATAAAVEEKMRELNVQVDNLCQFLAQDRVKEFAKLSPVDLLRETERAVGGLPLLQLHNRLEALQERHRSLARAAAARGEHLEGLRAQNAQLEHEVQRYRERQQLLERANTVRAKLAWVRVGEKRKEQEQAGREIQQQLARVIELKESLDPTDGQFSELQDSIKQCKTEITRLKKDGRTFDQRRTTAQNELSVLVQEYETANDEIENAEKARQDSQKKVLRYRNDIAKFEKKIAELRDPRDAQPEIERLRSQQANLGPRIDAVRQTLLNLQKSINNSANSLSSVKTELMRLENDGNKRYEMLHAADSRITRLCEWLRTHADVFDDKVWEPLCLHIVPKSEEAAVLLDAVIPKGAMISFMVSSPADGERLSKQARTMGIYGVAVMQLPRARAVTEELIAEDFKREIPHELPRHLVEGGVKGWITELFDAPPEVRWSLYTQFPAIIRTVYADKDVTDVVLNDPSLKGSIDKNMYHRFLGSRYDAKERIVQTSKYNRRSRFLYAGSDANKKAALREKIGELEREIEELKSRQSAEDRTENDLTAERTTIQDRLRELNDIPKARQELEKRIKNFQKLIVEEERSADFEETVEAAKEKMRELREQMDEKALALITPVRNVVNAALELDACIIREAELSLKLQELEARMEAERRELKDAEKTLKALKDAKKRLGEEVQSLKQAATKLCPMNEETVAEFAKIESNTVDELVQEMHNLEQQASLIFAISDEMIRQYENRKQEIEDAERAFSQEQGNLDVLQKRIVRGKHDWLHGTTRRGASGQSGDGSQGSGRRSASGSGSNKRRAVQLDDDDDEDGAAMNLDEDEDIFIDRGLVDLVKEISKNFENSMAELHCKGAVELREADNDFASYAIEIKVSFRDGHPMQTLSAEFHSGGERSVSTMMYLIALQPLTPAPFRLVDEINQAMDAVNERRIWEQVVAVSSRSGDVSQYFLVTPKLLNDLTFTDDMTVLVVFNGFYNMPQKEWNKALKMLEQ